MAHQNICLAMCALERPLIREHSAISELTRRIFHSSTKKFDEQSSRVRSPAPALQGRKDRSVTALQQLTSLQKNRIVPRALAKGSFPSGQTAQGKPQIRSSEQNESGFIPENANTERARGPDTSTSARMERQASPMPRGSAPPSGRMIRAPAQLRIARNTGTSSTREGPNLHGRDKGRNRNPSGRTASNNKSNKSSNNSNNDNNNNNNNSNSGNSRRNEKGPQRREKNKNTNVASQYVSVGETDPAATLSDAMVLQLLRLQRKEWDRVPYEPKYAPGSFAANELIHAGRELFRGESPPVKIWGPLERRIGLVGMHGAEATLKIRRVGDGNAEPFGQEILEAEDAERVDTDGIAEKAAIT